MKQLKLKPTFSFLYGRKTATLSPIGEEEKASGDIRTVKTHYRIGVLRITRTLRFYEKYGAVWHRITLKNEGDDNSEQISDLKDFDAVIPMPEETCKRWEATDTACALWSMLGSHDRADDYELKRSRFQEVNCRDEGPMRFSSANGRSSDGCFPYFTVSQGDDGLILAIGWSGQWNAAFSRTSEGVHLSSGLEDSDFYLKPAEEIYTSSVLILPYKNGMNAGHNTFRSLMREHFSPKAFTEKSLPLCINGGIATKSDYLCDIAELNPKMGYPFNYLWMDAGWYGPNEPDPNENVSEWPRYLGEWEINPRLHPNALVDVRDAAEKNGMRLLLWFEPERSFEVRKYRKKHPEWFISGTHLKWWQKNTYLWNLGDKAARDGMIDMLSSYVDSLHLGCLRWDFNTEPLIFWRDAEEEGRHGLFEIKYIMGLYEVWDTLSESFPDLLIDNCASGGRRLDFELYRRGIPLWRSDRQCYAVPVEEAEFHTAALSLYLPYHGTLASHDVKYARFSYAPTLNITPWGMQEHPSEYKKMIEEYLFARRFMLGDYEPVFSLSNDFALWGGHRYHLSEENEGILLLFRRARSAFREAEISLSLSNGKYEFVNKDTQERWASHTESGLIRITVRIEEACGTVLIHYKKVK